MENKSQEIPYEEKLFIQEFKYKDSFIMKDFHNENWDKKWILCGEIFGP